MKKLIMTIALAVVLCGCKNGPENAEHIGVQSIRYACINGHLYIVNTTVYDYKVFTPLFAADTDVPMLVQCPKDQTK